MSWIILEHLRMNITCLWFNLATTVTVMSVMIPAHRGIAPSLADMNQLLVSFQVCFNQYTIVTRMPWTAKEDDDALYLRMDMPGLGKEHVKVSVEQNTLIIKGECEKESGDEEEGPARRVSSRIDLPINVYKLDEIKAEIKNGVLKVVVPRVKEDHRKKWLLLEGKIQVNNQFQNA